MSRSLAFTLSVAATLAVIGAGWVMNVRDTLHTSATGAYDERKLLREVRAEFETLGRGAATAKDQLEFIKTHLKRNIQTTTSTATHVISDSFIQKMKGKITITE